ncbi:hypothetical protein [Halobaculum lipolyticum]|uniref:YiaAB two helix domain-containing protein n=1 Tax=Halobaculum lipolyticum TaxID=3032001 RepID=A0ABD5W845_9EURY|nr:hypothetical protein [Halobaculum sp. DT31]
MSLKQETETDGSVLERAAGVTGVGWTASALGYLGTVIGFGNTLVTNPQSLLYLGAVCFLATLGIDRLNDRRSDGDDAGELDPDGAAHGVEGGGERDLGDGQPAD